VLIDVGNLVILDLLPSIQAPGIEKWLRRLPDRDRIQVVSIRLRPHHRSVVRKVFGSSVFLMVEKRALIQLAGKGLEAVRRAVERRSPARRRNSDRVRLEAALRARDAFEEIYECRAPRPANEQLVTWRQSLNPISRRAFAPVIEATDAWHHEMLRFFDKRTATMYADYLSDVLIGIEKRYGRLAYMAARSQILNESVIEAPLGFNRCERCRQEFNRSKVHAKFTVPIDSVAQAPNARLRRMCGNLSLILRKLLAQLFAAALKARWVWVFACSLGR
jgi:hypothetical protein